MFGAGFEFAAGVLAFVGVVLLTIMLLKIWQILLAALITFVLPLIISFILLLYIFGNDFSIVNIALPIIIAGAITKKTFLRVFSWFPEGDDSEI